MTATFTAGLVQMAPAKTKAASLAKAASLVAEAAKAGASVVCLPELFATPYFCRTQDHAAFDLAEPIPGPTTQAMAKAARSHNVTVVAPLFERRGPGLYHNSLAVLGPDGELAGIYRKMHIPHDPGFEEKFYFTPGDLGFRAFPTPHGPVGALICWDQWFPEAARSCALLGAILLFYPTAIGWHPSEKAEFGPTQLDAWRTVQRAHAITNGLYVAAVNRVGIEGKGKNYGGTLESGDRPSWPTPWAASWPRPGRRRSHPHRRHRPRTRGTNPPPLAVFARPTHRRLRRPAGVVGGIDSGRRLRLLPEPLLRRGESFPPAPPERGLRSMRKKQY
jgi:N-carbamoylputrescine amidase